MLLEAIDLLVADLLAVVTLAFEELRPSILLSIPVVVSCWIVTVPSFMTVLSTVVTLSFKTTSEQSCFSAIRIVVLVDGSFTIHPFKLQV